MLPEHLIDHIIRIFVDRRYCSMFLGLAATPGVRACTTGGTPAKRPAHEIVSTPQPSSAAQLYAIQAKDYLDA